MSSWEYYPENYEDQPDLVDFIQSLQYELVERYKYISELEQANTSMLRLIQINDQKTALMEASPEFAEALKNIEQSTTPSPE